MRVCRLFAHILHLPLSSSFFTIICQISPIRAGITTLRLHPSQHLPSFTGCALLPLSQYITPFLSYFSSIFPSHMLHLFILHLSFNASLNTILLLNTIFFCVCGGCGLSRRGRNGPATGCSGRIFTTSLKQVGHFSHVLKTVSDT